MGHASVKIRGRLTVGGNNLDVSSALIAYELNNIPQASFSLSVGRGTGALAPAAIHKLADKLTPEMKVQFFCTLTLLESTDPAYSLPQGEFLLFDGYLTGLSLSKPRGSLTAVLHARNWLLDMDYSAATSEMSHPTNPSQFSFRTSHTFQGAGGVSWVPLVDKGFIDATTLSSDFWGRGLQPWLKALTALDLINKIELSVLPGGDTTNATAAAALSRFTTTSGNYVPLALDFGSADAQSVAAAIWNDVQHVSFDSTLGNTTLWGKLIGDYASRYLFAVVPRVSDALVVPYIPGLATTWKYSISGKDYDMVGTSSELQRKLRGVGILSGLGSRSGSNNAEKGANPASLGVGGWYSPPGQARGMIMLKQGPRWINHIISADRYSAFSSGAGTQTIGNAMHPGTVLGSGGSNAATIRTPPPPPGTLQAQSKYIFDAFAHALYVYEQLRLRQMELAGKLRFDIAPGSTIRIAPSFDKFIVPDALATPMVGDVLRVTYILDSDKKTASTNYNIGHVRTEYENGLPDFTVSRHPLWKNPWTGCGMLASYDK